MNEQRVAILDASHSLFDVHKAGTGTPAAAPDPLLEALVLQPIPRMREIAGSAVQSGLAAGALVAGKVAAIDIGVICNASGVGPLTRSIHRQIVEHLQR